MGLLASDPNDPLFGANMALAAGLVNGNFGGGLLGFGSAYREGQDGLLKRQYVQAQIDETLAQAAQRKSIAAREQAALENEARISAGLPSLFRQPGMTGGAPVPQSFPGTNVPQFSAPMGAGPMQQTPGGFDLQGALKLGITDPKKLAEYASLADIGKPKVARTVEVMRGGKPVLIQLDERGNEIGSGYDQWKAPQLQSLGGRVAAIDPVSLQERGSFTMSQSPDSLASNAIAIRGQNMTDARAREANQGGRVPPGYRVTADGSGLEYIPGGPADPNAAKRAAPTEFQGKSTTFAARMQDASKILEALQPEVSPAQVARAGYKPEFPNWLPGGQIMGAGIEAANKMTTPNNAQLFRQAQENWVTANLRQESGAAIGKEEMEKDIRKWFPQPGEPEALILQKAAARKVAERAMLVQAGPGASSIPGIVSGGSQSGAQPTMRWNPKTQQVEMVGQ